MQNDSTAVLTPELIHPDYFDSKKKYVPIQRINRSNLTSAISPLRQNEIEQRKRWSESQIEILKLIPSNAVLGL
ncbi:hypothetical protein [Acinetobacter venetianus]|uniref:hypothetical protein n=1 Tax=Acinetobacter venetianus TaxID=52133 RepID=UPI00214FB686|nr:hypothetical protein [Acinetobacter venetianus]MCR4529786.1 hypothetical protein [Acinetobacter venetianus]